MRCAAGSGGRTRGTAVIDDDAREPDDAGQGAATGSEAVQQAAGSADGSPTGETSDADASAVDEPGAAGAGASATGAGSGMAEASASDSDGAGRGGADAGATGSGAAGSHGAGSRAAGPTAAGTDEDAGPGATAGSGTAGAPAASSDAATSDTRGTGSDAAGPDGAGSGAASPTAAGAGDGGAAATGDADPGTDGSDAAGSDAAGSDAAGSDAVAAGTDDPAQPTPPPDTATPAPTGSRDATVVVPLRSSDDATVVVPTRPPEDATVVVPTRPAGDPTMTGPSGPPPMQYGQLPPTAQYPAAGAWAPPPGQNPYAPGGAPPQGGGFGPLPPGGFGPLPPGGAAAPAAARQPMRRGARRTLAIVGVVVLLAVIGGLIYLLVPPSPSSAVADAAEDARGWAGATYRGPIRGPGGEPVTADVTVGPNGDKTGTFTRQGGGRLEIAQSGDTQVVKGNAAWWSGLPQGADKGRRLAGVWLRNAAPETTWLTKVPLLAPGALADTLAGPPGGTPPEYTDAGDQPVDDTDGRVVTVPDRRVVLTDGHDARLLALVPPESTDPAGLRVSEATPDTITALGSARSTTAGAQDYTATLYTPDDVRVEVLPSPPCTTPTCSVAVRLTNAAGIEARGVVTIKKNGVVLNRYPFTLAAAGTQTFTSASPNAGIAAGRDLTVNYEAEVTAS